jgi:hypothetical protein
MGLKSPRVLNFSFSKNYKSKGLLSEIIEIKKISNSILLSSEGYIIDSKLNQNHHEISGNDCGDYFITTSSNSDQTKLQIWKN